MPLQWAARNRYDIAAKVLVDSGKVEANLKDFAGRTRLSWVAGNEYEAAVKALLHTAEVEAGSRDINGRALWWAAGNENEAIVKTLLDSGKVKADSKDQNKAKRRCHQGTKSVLASIAFNLHPPTSIVLKFL